MKLIACDYYCCGCRHKPFSAGCRETVRQAVEEKRSCFVPEPNNDKEQGNENNDSFQGRHSPGGIDA